MWWWGVHGRVLVRVQGVRVRVWVSSRGFGYVVV